MSLILSTATREDLPGIVRAQYAAFHPHNTPHRLIYPSPDPVPEAIIAKTVTRQQKTMEDPHVTWLKITDPTTNEIVAGAKWMIWPSSSPTTQDELETETLGAAVGSGKGKTRWPDKVDVNWILPEEKGMNAGAGSDDLEYVEWVMEEFFGRRRERIQGSAVLLDICFCAPTHHRRGAGKQLVEWGTARADELNLTAYVEASLTGRRLYESCGFVVTEDVCLDGGKVRSEWKEYEPSEYKWMVREKKGGEGRA